MFDKNINGHSFILKDVPAEIKDKFFFDFQCQHCNSIIRLKGNMYVFWEYSDIQINKIKLYCDISNIKKELYNITCNELIIKNII